MCKSISISKHVPTRAGAHHEFAHQIFDGEIAGFRLSLDRAVVFVDPLVKRGVWHDLKAREQELVSAVMGIDGVLQFVIKPATFQIWLLHSSPAEATLNQVVEAFAGIYRVSEKTLRLPVPRVSRASARVLQHQ
jgi:hypothetical protein